MRAHAAQRSAPPAVAPPTRVAPRVQPQLRIGAVDDPLEREADRMADAVMAGGMAGVAGVAGNDRDGPVRRSCAACAAKDDDPIRREASGREVAPSGATRAAAVLATGGAPLSSALRAYFEPRFGRSFAPVRLHTDAAAGAAADAIGARAFTLSDRVAFAPGAFAPETAPGRRLIAHELAHVAQQSPLVRRQVAPVRQRRFADRAGGGTTDFEETVQDAPTRTGGVIEGDVHRRAIAPVAAGHPAEQEVHKGDVHVRMETGPTCRIVLPFKFDFEEDATAPAPFCQEPPSATPVPPLAPGRLNTIGQNYVQSINAGMNNWYQARITGCTGDCADRPIPIVIEARRDTSGPHTTLSVVNRSGRGNSGTICLGANNPAFALHEGGHQVLGVGDEYAERDAGELAKHPEWGRSERVRSDRSMMRDQDAGGALFHERHFRFAQVFLEAAFPGCSVRLEALPRPIIPRLILGFDLGYVGTNRGSGIGIGGKLGVGVPLDRERVFSVLLAAEGRVVLPTDFRQRTALLGGIHLGIERASSSFIGPRIALGVTGGAIHGGGGKDAPARTHAFGEVSADVGLALGPLTLGARGALGTEIASDPEALRWYRLGVEFGARF